MHHHAWTPCCIVGCEGKRHHCSRLKMWLFVCLGHEREGYAGHGKACEME